MYLNTNEAAEKFNMSRPTVLELFSMKGSPAFRVGKGRGHWRVDEHKFEQFMIKQSEKYKGERYL